MPTSRRASVRTLFHPLAVKSSDSVLDSGALVLFFQGPTSATGEDVLELHVHGGLAVVEATLQAIPRCSVSRSTIRYAEPGEFTRRAFFNQRLDLTQVEALGDVLAAVTEQQRKISLRGTTSQLACKYERWRIALLHARSELEALIDFSEDQHFEESSVALLNSVTSQILDLKSQIQAHLENALRGELLRNGIRVTLLGSPNAGKSSLLNTIVGRDAAIVSPEAGTTRDIVDIGLDIGGYLCHFGDTAGLRAGEKSEDGSDDVGAVEKEGMRRAKARAQDSDVVIVVVEIRNDEFGQSQLVLDPEVLETVARCNKQGIRVLAVINKVDLIPAAHPAAQTRLIKDLCGHLGFLAEGSIFLVSCKAHAHGGLDALQTNLIATFATMTSTFDQDESQNAIGVSERHRSLLTASLQHLESFLVEANPVFHVADVAVGSDVVLAAEALREGATCLARITGTGETGDIEEVLGVIFAKFCVGK